jgi:hypothetical protein
MPQNAYFDFACNILKLLELSAMPGDAHYFLLVEGPPPPPMAAAGGGTSEQTSAVKKEAKWISAV